MKRCCCSHSSVHRTPVGAHTIISVRQIETKWIYAVLIVYLIFAGIPWSFVQCAPEGTYRGRRTLSLGVEQKCRRFDGSKGTSYGAMQQSTEGQLTSRTTGNSRVIFLEKKKLFSRQFRQKRTGVNLYCLYHRMMADIARDFRLDCKKQLLFNLFNLC